MALDILIVDDETDIRDLVSGVLEDEGYGTRTASSIPWISFLSTGHSVAKAPFSSTLSPVTR